MHGPLRRTNARRGFRRALCVDEHRLDGSAPSFRAVLTPGAADKARGTRGGALELDLWAPASRAVSRARSLAVQSGHHRSPSASVPAANAGGAVGGTSVALLVCARARAASNATSRAGRAAPSAAGRRESWRHLSLTTSAFYTPLYASRAHSASSPVSSSPWTSRAPSARVAAYSGERAKPRDAGAQRSSSNAPPRAPRAASGAQRGGVARAGGAEPSRRRSSTLIARRHPVRALPPPRATARQAREQPRSCGAEGAGLAQTTRARDPARRRARPESARARRLACRRGARLGRRSTVLGLSSTNSRKLDHRPGRARTAVTENHRVPARVASCANAPRIPFYWPVCGFGVKKREVLHYFYKPTKRAQSRRKGSGRNGLPETLLSESVGLRPSR